MDIKEFAMILAMMFVMAAAGAVMTGLAFRIFIWMVASIGW